MPDNLVAISSDTLKDTDVSTARQSQTDLFEWFRKVVPQHPDIQFIYRGHHSEASRPELKELADTIPNFFCISKEAIKHWIIACDKIYNWESTSAIEVFVAEKQNFVLRPVELPWEVDLPLFKGAQIIDNCEDFDKSMSLPLDAENQPFDSAVMHDYYEMDDRFTFHKLCDYLEETHHSDSYSSTQYKTSTRFSRFMERTYASFITSHFAVSVLSKIYNSSSNGPVAKFVRKKGVPEERKLSGDYQYNLSRKALN